MKLILKARGQGLGVGGQRQRDGGADMCSCPSCGATMKHERGVPCSEVSCPECGTAMSGMSKSQRLLKAGRFGVGTADRAKRNVFAKELEDEGVDEPYAVATAMVKKGYKARQKDIKKKYRTEKKRQKKEKQKLSKEN